MLESDKTLGISMSHRSSESILTFPPLKVLLLSGTFTPLMQCGFYGRKPLLSGGTPLLSNLVINHKLTDWVVERLSFFSPVLKRAVTVNPVATVTNRDLLITVTSSGCCLYVRPRFIMNFNSPVLSSPALYGV